MSSDSYYEDLLIACNGIQVKMGVSNSFDDDFYYENNVYDMSKTSPHLEKVNNSILILVHCLYKNVSPPDPDKFLEIYGTMVLDILDFEQLILAIRKVANDIECGIRHKPFPSEGSRFEKSIADYGGEIVLGKQRGFKPSDDSTIILTAKWDILFHVHEWVDYSSGDCDIMISCFSKDLEDPNNDYEIHDYSSVFIRIGYEEKFITALQQMKDRLESSVSLPQDS